MHASSILQHPFGLEEWTPAIAERRAVALGLAPLSERHWRVIAACREEAARHGRLPGLAALGRLTALPRAALVQLFGTEKLTALAAVAALAGLAAPPLHLSSRQSVPRRSLAKED